MIISVTIYVLAIACLLWGGKFAGFKGFHENFLDVEVTKAAGGFAAVVVILHHISQEQIFQDSGILSAFVHVGFWCVAIFFFISGYGLLKSLDTKPDYLKGFLRKRLPIIIVPYYTSAIIYTVFRLAIGEKMPIGQILCGLIGIVMANEYAWYPIVLTILYLAFYVIFKHLKNRSLGIFLIFILTLLLGLLFCVNGHFAWWAGRENWWLMGDPRKWWMEEKVLWFSGEWWVNSQIAFVLGLVFANHEEALTNWLKKGYFVKLLLVLALTIGARKISTLAQWNVGYWTEWNGNGPDIVNKIICYIAQIPEIATFTILVVIILMKYHASNAISNFFGKYSYETYMMNLLAIMCARPILYNLSLPEINLGMAGSLNLGHVLYILFVFGLSAIYGVIYRKINSILLRRK